jgi:hypothetical protein
MRLRDRFLLLTLIFLTTTTAISEQKTFTKIENHQWPSMIFNISDEKREKLAEKLVEITIKSFSDVNFSGVDSVGGWSRFQVGSLTATLGWPFAIYAIMSQTKKDEKLKKAYLGLVMEQQIEVLQLGLEAYTGCLIQRIARDEAIIEKYPKKDKIFTIDEALDIQDIAIKNGWAIPCTQKGLEVAGAQLAIRNRQNVAK